MAIVKLRFRDSLFQLLASSFVIAALPMTLMGEEPMPQGTDIASGAFAISKELHTILEGNSAREGAARIASALGTASPEEINAIITDDDIGASVLAYCFYLRSLPHIEPEGENASPGDASRMAGKWLRSDYPEAVGRRYAMVDHVARKLPFQLPSNWGNEVLMGSRGYSPDDAALDREWIHDHVPYIFGLRFYSEYLVGLGVDDGRSTTIEPLFIEVLTNDEVRIDATVTLRKQDWATIEENDGIALDYCYVTSVGSHYVVVFHSSTGGRGKCVLFDKESGDEQWSSTCWGYSGCVFGTSGSWDATIDGVIPSEGVLYVFGHGGRDVYVEGFRISDGRPMLRFSSNWWNCD